MNKFNFRNMIIFTEVVQDDSPEPGGKEEEVTRAWADIKTMQGRDYTRSEADNILGISRFIIRYIPDIVSTMKIVFKGQKYTILSIVNDNEQNKTLTIIAETII